MATSRTSMTPFGAVVHVSANMEAMTPFGFVAGTSDLSVGSAIKQIFFGPDQVQKIFYGADEVQEVWYGNDKIYEA